MITIVVREKVKLSRVEVKIRDKMQSKLRSKPEEEEFFCKS
jgi:hypothetical protein